MMRHTRRTRPTHHLDRGRLGRRALVAGAVLALALTGCSDLSGSSGTGTAGSADGEAITLARADWDTGWFQAEVYRQLLSELGYTVNDPTGATRDANGFYPALARGEYDLWANGWFPLHEPYMEGELVTGQKIDADVTPVGEQVDNGAQQGYLVDASTAEELGLTSMSDLADASVAATFDADGNGKADLIGCNEGWGCHLTIDQHIAELDWGDNVEQVSGDYNDLFADVAAAVEAGEPVLFYTWTPNWTIAEIVPGEDVVWLPSPSLEGATNTAVEGLEGCAGGADPCDLGWQVNDIRAVGNTDFLDDHPDVQRLLEVVTIPLDDIAAVNDELRAGGEITTAALETAAETWITDNRTDVDAWLETARG